jgi:HTH-type transcriptional regulator/antitoxin HipB
MLHFVPAAALFSQELGIRYIDLTLSRIQNMDYELITTRLGKQIRQRRLNRGMTQARLAELARVTRQKVIAIEKGDLSVGMTAYARVLAALNCELTVIPAVLPTLDEIHGIFD